MAKIGIENITELKIEAVTEERKYDSVSISPAVQEMYERKEYENRPKNDKANGLKSSFFDWDVNQTEDGARVLVSHVPTRYLVGQALRDLVNDGEISVEEARNMSPDMANVSVVCPVQFEGEYALLAQIKGEKVLGGGAIHAGLAAGNVDGTLVGYENPLAAALKAETLEEVGIEAGALDPTAFKYLVDERETGQVNFAAIAQGQDVERILEAYARITTPKMVDGKPEVEGLALVAFGAQTNSEGKLETMCFLPSETGIDVQLQTRDVRPYTEAWLAYLAKKENQETLVELAGL